jgi:hypothetical protein
MSLKGTSKFKIKEEKYLPAYDVDQFEFTMEFKTEMQVKGTAQNPSGISNITKGKVTGTLHSQKEGTIKFLADHDIKVEGSSRSATGRGKMLYRYEFPKFVAEAVSQFDSNKNTSANSRSSFKLNGKEMTKQEMDLIVSKGPSGMFPVFGSTAGTGAGSNPRPTPGVGTPGDDSFPGTED